MGREAGGWMDGSGMDRQREWAGRQTDKQTERAGQTDSGMDGAMGGQTVEKADGQKDAGAGGGTDGRTDGRLDSSPCSAILPSPHLESSPAGWGGVTRPQDGRLQPRSPPPDPRSPEQPRLPPPPPADSRAAQL